MTTPRITHFLPSKKLSPPSLPVKTFSYHFPFICTPNFPRSLFFHPEYGSSRFLRKARRFLQDYTTSHPPGQYSTHSLPCEPHILQNFQQRLLQGNFANHPHRLQNLKLSVFTARQQMWPKGEADRSSTSSRLSTAINTRHHLNL